MPDPVPVQTAQLLAQTVKSSALMALLKSGPQRGVVTSQQQDRAEVNIRGHKVNVDAKALNLKVGQQVLAKLSGGKIHIQPQHQGQALSGQASSGTESGAKAVAQALAQMGLSGSNFEMLAQALVRAGIPLNPLVLKELAQVLPQLSANQLSSLQFLLSRGMPINSSILSLITQLFSQKQKPGQAMDQLLSSLDQLDRNIDEEEWAIDPEKRRQLRDHRQALARQFIDMNALASAKDEQELQQLIKNMLTSAEAGLQKGSSSGTLGETLLRLITLLMELQAQTEDPKLLETLQKLIQQAQQLHENFSAQHLKNVPPQGQEAFPTIFLQVPFREGEDTRDLELRYQKEDEVEKGSLDLRFELSAFGPMWINFNWHSPQLTVSIVTEKQEVQAFLEPMLEELQKALEDKGFVSPNLTVRVDEVPESLEPEPLEDEIDQVNGLDLRA